MAKGGGRVSAPRPRANRNSTVEAEVQPGNGFRGNHVEFRLFHLLFRKAKRRLAGDGIGGYTIKCLGGGRSNHPNPYVPKSPRASILVIARPPVSYTERVSQPFWPREEKMGRPRVRTTEMHFLQLHHIPPMPPSCQPRNHFFLAIDRRPIPKSFAQQGLRRSTFCQDEPTRDRRLSGDSKTSNLLPRPYSLKTSNVSPNSSTRRSTMANPRPLPSESLSLPALPRSNG